MFVRFARSVSIVAAGGAGELVLDARREAAVRMGSGGAARIGALHVGPRTPKAPSARGAGVVRRELARRAVGRRAFGTVELPLPRLSRRTRFLITVAGDVAERAAARAAGRAGREVEERAAGRQRGRVVVACLDVVVVGAAPPHSVGSATSPGTAAVGAAPFELGDAVDARDELTGSTPRRRTRRRRARSPCGTSPKPMLIAKSPVRCTRSAPPHDLQIVETSSARPSRAPRWPCVAGHGHAFNAAQRASQICSSPCRPTVLDVACRSALAQVHG
jgi:hypothetical protein